MKEKLDAKKTNAKSKIKGFTTCLFFFFLLFTVLLLIFLEICDFKTSRAEDKIRNVTSIFTCITASVSLYIASAARKEAINNRIIDRKNDITQNWYNTLIIKRHLEAVLMFFDSCVKLIGVLKEINANRENISYSDYDEQCKAKVMKPFTKQYTRLQYSLVSDAKIISVELSNKLYELFAEFQDGFATRVDTKNPNYETIKNYITDTQVNMVKLIKEYNTDMMD